MTPYRTESLAGYALGSVKSLVNVPVDSTNVALASVAAVVGWMVGASNVQLFWVILGAMAIDLLVGGLGAVLDPLQEFTVARMYGGIVGKIFRLLLVPTASLADALYIASPLPLPDGYADSFPITAFIMVCLALAEIISALKKFRERGVVPGAIAVVMRHLDQIKLGSEPPMRRDYDKAAIAEIERRREDDL